MFIFSGFGPFGEHEVNASWVAVQELAKIGLDNSVELLVCEIPVIYKDVKERVPLLWKKYEPTVSIMITKICVQICSGDTKTCSIFILS